MKTTETTSMKSGAVISECGKFRYQLFRIWAPEKPLVLFVMHNPSTADASEDDPTIRRCIGFAKSWGFGGIYVGNLSPVRATDPKDVYVATETVYRDNRMHIELMRGLTHLVIFAHGIPSKNVPAMGRQPGDCYLKLTAEGHPGHPLYLKSDLQPKQFKQ